MNASMGNSPGLFESNLLSYDRFRKQGGLSPGEQEVVFLTISHENDCEYCVAAHSIIADRMFGVPRDVLDAIRDGSPIPDPKLGELSDFTRTRLEKRGSTAGADAERFVRAGYSENQALAILLTIAVKTLSNRPNRMFQTEVDDMFFDWAWLEVAGRAG